MNDLEGSNREKDASLKEVSSLQIVYQDEVMVIIDKPSGVMTHKSRIAEDESASAMELLRDQIGRWVYPVHRLDRATSGLLVFGLDKDSARALHSAFANGDVEKKYWAVTRGHGPQAEVIDRPLKEKRDRVTDKKADRDKPAQRAKTVITTLAHCTLPVPLGRYPSARFSLVEARPLTGRRHQLRRHLAGISYPIIGDTTHGRGEQNRFFRAHFNSHRLMLAAVSIALPHPKTGQRQVFQTPLSGSMSRVCRSLFQEEAQVNLKLSVGETNRGAVEVGQSANLTWLSDPNAHRHLFASTHA